MLKRKKGMHRHHIIPKHMGGTDDSSNIVYLTIEEHIAAHEKLYEQYGLDADKGAISLLKYGESNPDIAAKESHKAKIKNGFYKKLGELNSKRLKGIENPDHSERLKLKYELEGTEGLTWWNNGEVQTRVKDCPGEGWVKGRLDCPKMRNKLKERYKDNPPLWWNNGLVNTRSSECPGEEWTRGKAKIK